MITKSRPHFCIILFVVHSFHLFFGGWIWLSIWYNWTGKGASYSSGLQAGFEGWATSIEFGAGYVANNATVSGDWNLYWVFGLQTNSGTIEMLLVMFVVYSELICLSLTQNHGMVMVLFTWCSLFCIVGRHWVFRVHSNASLKFSRDTCLCGSSWDIWYLHIWICIFRISANYIHFKLLSIIMHHLNSL